MLRIDADHANDSLALNDLAFVANLLDTGPNFHDFACTDGRILPVFTVSVCVLTPRRVTPCPAQEGSIPAGARLALLVSVDDSALGQIVGGEFDLYAVASQDADVVHAHFSADVAENFHLIFV